MTRVTEFGLGILIYLIVSSPKACAALRTRPWVCTTVSALTSAFIMSACIADADARPRPTEVSPLSARLGVHVVVLGVLAPLSTAWLILYTLVRPGLPATWAAAILGSNKWDWFAARTYSVFLLHPFVYFGVFQAVPVTAWIGPLDHFSTYATVLGLVTGISFGLAWVQDVMLERLIRLAWKPAKSSKPKQQPSMQWNQQRT